MPPRSREPAPQPEQPIADLPDDAILTQFGNRLNPGFCIVPFRNQLRPGEKGLSLTLGKRSVKEMVDVMYRGRRSAIHHDGIRRTTAGELRAAGFVVVHDGFRSKSNPNHVTVSLDGDTDWTDDESARFNDCFSEPVWLEGDDD